MKEKYTFSPYLVGSHVEWLLADEGLQRKALKWIGQNSEKKGEADMNVESFRRYLSGEWDETERCWKVKGLLSDVSPLHAPCMPCVRVPC